VKLKNEESKWDAEWVQSIVNKTVAKLKGGAAFEEPTSTINIDDIKKLTNAQKLDAINKAEAMETTAKQTTITARLIKGLIIETFDTTPPSLTWLALAKQAGLHQQEVRKATALVKVWKVAKNLLNFNLADIPASTLWKFSKHFLAVVKDLNESDELILLCSMLTLRLSRITTVSFQPYPTCLFPGVFQVGVTSVYARYRLNPKRSKLGEGGDVSDSDTDSIDALLD
jgi:hypothetical protein